MNNDIKSKNTPVDDTNDRVINIVESVKWLLNSKKILKVLTKIVKMKLTLVCFWVIPIFFNNRSLNFFGNEGL